MIQGRDADPTGERKLREKIQAGSQDVDDYRDLAQILWESGREEEAPVVLEQALSSSMPDIQRASISAEMAWMLYQFREDDRAITIAQAALSRIPTYVNTPEAVRIRALSYTTLAHCTYPMDRAASDQASTRALEALEELVNEYPDYAYFVEACLHAAQVHILQEDYEKAVAFYELASRSDPSERNRLECLFAIGSARRCQGRYAEAEASLREALQLIQVNERLLPRIHFELGKVQRLTDRLEEAIAAFRQSLTAVELNPHLRRDKRFVAEIKWELGNLYYDIQKYPDAISALTEALRDLPEPYPYFEALVSLGHCYLVMRQHAKARECYDEVLASENASKEEKATAREGLTRLPPLPPPRVH